VFADCLYHPVHLPIASYRSVTPRQMTRTGVAVEKGTKAVISVNFSPYGERTFNSLRANFAGEIPRKEFFNSHRRLH
jgi:hypothetical protein